LAFDRKNSQRKDTDLSWWEILHILSMLFYTREEVNNPGKKEKKKTGKTDLKKNMIQIK